MTKKKMFIILLSTLTLGSTLTACGKTEETQKATANSSPQTILAEPFTAAETQKATANSAPQMMATEPFTAIDIPQYEPSYVPKQAATEKPTKAKRSATYTLSGNTLTSCNRKTD